MKTKTILNIFFFVIGILFPFSCKKGIDQTLNIHKDNHSPIANAGTDQSLFLPTNKTILDGVGSTDQDNNIISYAWAKISGPPWFEIHEARAVQITVTGLGLGTYQFELTVYDDGLLYSKDTVQVVVHANVNAKPDSVDCNGKIRTQIKAQLIPIGSLSQKREDIEIASVGNKILFAGGSSEINGGTLYANVDIYDIRTNIWKTGALSQAEKNMTSAVLGNKIFFAGLAGIDIYDVTSGIFSKKTLNISRDNMSAAAAGNKVLFAGGIANGFKQTSPIIIFDANTDSWSETSFPGTFPGNFIGLAGIAATAIGSKIYFAGNASDWFYWDEGSITSAINIYDVNTNTWSTSDLSIRRGFMASIAVDNKIYWAGGIYREPYEPFTDLVEIRDVNTGISTFACLFQPNAFFTAVQKNNKIVFFTTGGDMPDYWPYGAPVLNKFDIYDISSNTWSIGVLPVNISGSAVISVDNIIYVAGGYVNGVLSNQVYKLEF